jgi:diguanylate cyclase (GGDEF)-like protein/PAS domain S-box-containing protein
VETKESKKPGFNRDLKPHSFEVDKIELPKSATDLKDSELRYRRLFETAQDGILILDGDSGIITDANKFITDMLKYSRKELVGKKLWEIGAFIDVQKSKKAYEELQKNGYVRYEDIPLESKDGKRLEVEFVSNIYQVNHHKVIQCNIRDISERKEFERKISFLANHDVLTGLPNRTLLNDRFNVARAQADRSRKKLAVMSLDLDRFKTINDHLGHDVGDIALKITGDKLVSVLRKSDTVARVGGDEFVLLLSEIEDKQNCLSIAQKILDAFQKPNIINDYEIEITPSIGIAVYPDEGEDLNTLMKKADRFLYSAKESGGNNFKYSSI